jgi:LacI family transcriptional regulator
MTSRKRANSNICKIGLLLSEKAEYGRGVLLGIANFAKDHPNLQFRLEAPTIQGLRLLARWEPDGLIVMLNHKGFIPDLMTLKKPYVNVCKLPGSTDVLRVQSDDQVVGRLGAEHLLDRRAATYGFVGLEDGEYVEVRAKAFAKTIHGAGHPGVTSLRLRSDPGESEKSRLSSWLRQCVKPLAVMTSNDACGRLVLEVCREMNLSIPDEVAVLGVDNDDPASRLVWPGLSSIALATEQIGQAAARLLNRSLTGRPLPRTCLFIAPLGVVLRGSTQQTTVSDPFLAKAITAIYEGAAGPLSVDDLLKVVPLSRASLERRFRQFLNRTPLQEIRRVRIAHVRQLLMATDLPLKDIASRCGYSAASRLIESFQQETGQSLSSYRRQIALKRESANTDGKA